MSKSTLGHKVANETYKYFTGQSLSEADEWEREHFKAVRELLGGIALTFYGCGLEGVVSGVEGDVLGAPPIVVGLYFASKGFGRALENIQSQSGNKSQNNLEQ